MSKKLKVPWREGIPEITGILFVKKGNRISLILNFKDIPDEPKFMYFSDLCDFLREADKYSEKGDDQENVLRARIRELEIEVNDQRDGLFQFNCEADKPRTKKLEAALQKLSTLNENQMVSGAWVAGIAKEALRGGE